MTNTNATPRKVLRCPHCRKTIQWEGNPYRPFCSQRCRLIDLGAWAAEEYRVPLDETPPPPSDHEES